MFINSILWCFVLQITLLREYAQGVGEMMFVLPSGAYDPQRHRNDPMTGAKAELSEEVRLGLSRFKQNPRAGITMKIALGSWRVQTEGRPGLM